MDWARFEAEAQWLSQQRAAGQMGDQEYAARAQQLQGQDSWGRHWYLDPSSGQWYVYTEQGWMESSPPYPQQASVPHLPPVPKRGGSPRPVIIAVAAGVIALICLAVAAISLLPGRLSAPQVTPGVPARGATRSAAAAPAAAGTPASMATLSQLLLMPTREQPRPGGVTTAPVPPTGKAAPLFAPTPTPFVMPLPWQPTLPEEPQLQALTAAPTTPAAPGPARAPGTKVAAEPPTVAASPGAPPPPAPAVPKIAPVKVANPSYGMCIHLHGQDSSKVLGLVKGAGFGWVKLQILWSEYEPEKEKYQWAELDKMVNAVADSGLKLLVSVTRAPAWAAGKATAGGAANLVGNLQMPTMGPLPTLEPFPTIDLRSIPGAQMPINIPTIVMPTIVIPTFQMPNISIPTMGPIPNVSGQPGAPDSNVEVTSPPADPADFARFLTAMATHYKGKITAYEIWNEQNLWYEWGGRGNLSPVAYVQLLKAAYPAIKAVDPTAVVVSGGLTPTGTDDGSTAIDDLRFLREMYAAGLKDYCDAVGAHASGYNNPADADYTTYDDPSATFRHPYTNRHRSWFYRATVEAYRQAMVENGDGDKQLWLTEFGWASCGGNIAAKPGYEYCQDNTEYDQSEFLRVAFLTAKQKYPFLGGMFVWNLNYGPVVGGNDERAAFSLMSPDGGMRLAYKTLADMEKK